MYQELLAKKTISQSKPLSQGLNLLTFLRLTANSREK